MNININGCNKQMEALLPHFEYTWCCYTKMVIQDFEGTKACFRHRAVLRRARTFSYSAAQIDV